MSTLPTAPLLPAEPIEPTEPTIFGEEVLAAERLEPNKQPMVVDQSQRVEEQTTSKEQVAHMTKELFLRPKFRLKLSSHALVHLPELTSMRH